MNSPEWRQLSGRRRRARRPVFGDPRARKFRPRAVGFVPHIQGQVAKRVLHLPVLLIRQRQIQSAHPPATARSRPRATDARSLPALFPSCSSTQPRLNSASAFCGSNFTATEKCSRASSICAQLIHRGSQVDARFHPFRRRVNRFSIGLSGLVERFRVGIAHHAELKPFLRRSRCHGMNLLGQFRRLEVQHELSSQRLEGTRRLAPEDTRPPVFRSSKSAASKAACSPNPVRFAGWSRLGECVAPELSGPPAA